MDALEQQKIQVMIDLATQKFKKEIEDLKTKISGFESEIGSLRSKLMSSQQQPIRPVMQEESSKPQTRLNVQEHSRPETSKEAIDRNGVAPADVSIEKMFYCGNKRF